MQRMFAVFGLLFFSSGLGQAFAGDVSVPNQNIKPKILDELKVYAGDMVMRWTPEFASAPIVQQMDTILKNENFDGCMNGHWYQGEDAREQSCKKLMNDMGTSFENKEAALQVWRDALSESSAKLDAFLNTVLDPKLRDLAKYQQDMLEYHYNRLSGMIEKEHLKTLDKFLEELQSDGATAEPLQAFLKKYKNYLETDLPGKLGGVRRYFMQYVDEALDAVKKYPKGTLVKDPKIVRLCGFKGTVEQRYQDCLVRLDSNQTSFFTADMRYEWNLVQQDGNGNQYWRDNSTGKVWMSVNDQKMDLESAKDKCSFQTSEMSAPDILGFSLPTQEDFQQAYDHGLTQLFESANDEQWALHGPSMIPMEWAWSFVGKTGTFEVVGADGFATPRYARCVAGPALGH